MQKKKKTKVVVGLGKTGLSMVHYCADQGWPVFVMDSRKAPPGLNEIKTYYPDMPIVCGLFDAKKLELADEILLSPGVSPFAPLFDSVRARSVPIVGDVELFSRAAVQAPVIAITGTNGKGTVTTLVAELLKAAGYRVAVGGNIGTPVLDLLRQAVPDYYVLELSSAQLQVTYSLKPKSAAILNISADHEDYHRSFSDYKEAKQRIYHAAERCVYAQEDKRTYPQRGGAESISFSLTSPQPGHFGVRTHQGKAYLSDSIELIFPLPFQATALQGEHNQRNVLAALALVQAELKNWEPARKVLTEFKGLKYRCQWIRCTGAVHWYNDSKGSNTAATVAAINRVAQSQQGPLILIMGGIAKQEDLRELVPALRDHVHTVLVFGQDSDRLAAVSTPWVATQRVAHLTEAVQTAHALAKPQGVVLFSPACASFDMFQNAEERGERFTALVEALGE